MTPPLYAGIDAGGTQFKCIVATGPEQITAEHKVDVTTPEATLKQCAQFFHESFQKYGAAKALGIASFGPIELNKQSPQYGCITTTPKPSWKNTAIVDYFKSNPRFQYDLPIAFDTDVNGALLAEAQWGAAKNLQHAVYVTIGTGIGIGAMCDGQLLHGNMHPEAGHMRVTKHPKDTYKGNCPFHSDCLEGLASGPALAQRLGYSADQADDNHPIWQTQAHYLGTMCMNLALSYSPQCIILGGGVMARDHLLACVQQQFTEQLNGYLDQTHSPTLLRAALGQKAGALGAIALAQRLDA